MTRRVSATLMTLIGGAVLALALVAAPATPATADRASDHDRARAAMRAGEIVPLRDIVDIVTGQFSGEMVEAELDRKGPFWIYEITLVAPDGAILKLNYDAATTRLIRARGHEVEQWFKGAPEDFPDIAAARSDMHKRAHEHWHRKWRGKDGEEVGWFRRWWRERWGDASTEEGN